MARPAADIESFFNLSEVQRLLDIARSDNALVALAVERREISWTQFMAWLLDPVRVPAETARQRADGLAQIALDKLPEQPGNPAGDRLAGLRGRQIDTVLEVVPEQSIGKAGRIDLVVHAQAGGESVRLLIENKIDANEHADQLAGYVAYYQRRHADDLLLPVLIDLGDHPAEESTCRWAACLGRIDIAGWLEGMDSTPAIVRDYIAIFEAWELGTLLRDHHQRTIDRIRAMKRPPDTWRLIEGWLMTNELPYYQEMLKQPALMLALEDHSFCKPELRGRMKSEHDILKLTKPAWTLYPCSDRSRGVQIHFECDGRGKLRLDIEVYPYEGSIEKKPDRMAALAQQLELKAIMHVQVRSTLKKFQMPAGVRFRHRGLTPPHMPSANSAGRFERTAGEDCTPGEYAEFIASVIRVVAPAIDEVVACHHSA